MDKSHKCQFFSTTCSTTWDLHVDTDSKAQNSSETDRDKWGMNEKNALLAFELDWLLSTTKTETTRTFYQQREVISPLPTSLIFVKAVILGGFVRSS